MKFSLENPLQGHVVRGYEPGRILVDAAVYEQNLIVMADLLQPGWEPDTVADLAGRHITALAQHRPEIVIIGTGEKQVFPPRRLFVGLIDLQIGYEIMDTAAACRTYNILANEGRRVLGAFFV